MRASGILLHISSLPSPYGIGTFGKEAYQFVDFLERAGQKFWQILPIGPTSYGDSPYQSFSTFAGNPYFIDLDLLKEDGLLEPGDYENLDWGDQANLVDYEKIYQNRFVVLRKAYEKGFPLERRKVEAFRKLHNDWIEDYALFMALKSRFEDKAWTSWEESIRRREPEALAHWRQELKDQVDFWVYLQYLFYQQWEALKEYANQRKVKMIGDLPIYVAMDSADVWANPQLFQLDKDLRPTFVAGVPPDYFAPEGQLWGNPLYRWELHKQTGYDWWIRRMKAATTIYDTVRIDHFRGFAGYYAVPFGDENAVNGKWVKGPGMELFQAMERALGKRSIIAEDLGVLTEDVHKLLKDSGFPGMKVLQFAFEPNWDNGYLPHNHVENCVVYTGTHDNDTLTGWWETALDDHERKHALDYLHITPDEGIHWGMLRGAWSSVAWLTVAPIQDFLQLGKEARMNTPSTLGGNWRFRLLKGQLTEELADRIERLSGLYQRSAR